MGSSGRVAAIVVALVALIVPVALIVAVAPAGAVAPARHGPPIDRTVDGVVQPIGVDPDGVTFAWRLDDTRPAARQSAYRILLATSPTRDADSSGVVWDSGIVASAQQAFVPYAGPALGRDTQYWWTVAVANGAGAFTGFADPQSFVTGLRDGDWRGQWIRPGPAPAQPDEYTYVRKDVRLGASPIARATAYVGAAHRYQLWIDGVEVDAGPSFAYPDQQYYQATDVTKLLRAGAVNAVGVLHHWYGAGQGRPESAPGLIVQISVLHRDGTRELLVSDGTWREHGAEWQPAPPRNDEGDFTERIDGRAAPLGWASPSFDDAGWPRVPVLGPAGTPPFTHLVAQRTRIVEQPVRPVSVRKLAGGAIVADYGAIIAATPTVAFRRGRDGRRVAMHVGDLLDADGEVSTIHGVQGTDLSYGYVERAGTQRFHPFGYLAFRYLELDGPGERLGPGQLVALARHAALPTEPPATFTSSNSTLDAVFQLTAHSAEYSSQEQFLDTPTREKGQFLADAFDESQAVMHGFGDQNLSWQALRDFARSQARYWPDGRLNAVYPNGDGKRDIPDNTELYPEWLWQYYLSTGDRATLAAYYPVAVGIADYVGRAIDRTTGLVTRLPGGDGDYLYGIVDWPPAMRYGYDVNTAARTTVNALAVDVFDRTSQIAAALGRPADAATERARGSGVTAAMNTRLVRADGVYVDGLESNGAQSTHASQQANAYALAFGIVPRARVAPVGAQVARLGISTGPDDGLWLLRGLHAAGRDTDLVQVLSDRKDPGWARIVASGGTFTWESWTPDEAQGDSLSHGWGSSALVAFQEALLGVQAVPAGPGPGGPTFDVTEPSAGLPRVEGTIPTVAGTMRVEWRRRGSTTTLELTVPPNASATVHLAGAPVRTVGAGAFTLRSYAGTRPESRRSSATRSISSAGSG